MKDADYRVRDEDEFEEERVKMRYRHEDKPFKRLKDYAMAVAFGVGIGMGAMMFWYEKASFLKIASVQEAKTNYYDIGIPNGMELSQKGYDALYQGFRDAGKKHGWYDGRVWMNWCEILRSTGDKVYDANVKQLLTEVNNSTGPIAKLLCKYRGPKKAQNPSQADEEQLEELYQKYERFQPTIDALMDENYDKETTREERNRALYKLFHQ